MTLFEKFFARLRESTKTDQDCAREAHKMRDRLTEREIDKTLADSFPASDPPAWY